MSDKKSRKTTSLEHHNMSITQKKPTVPQAKKIKPEQRSFSYNEVQKIRNLLNEKNQTILDILMLIPIKINRIFSIKSMALYKNLLQSPHFRQSKEVLKDAIKYEKYSVSDRIRVIYNFKRDFSRACKKANIPCTLHHIRYTSAVDHLMADAPIDLVRELLGHRVSTVTKAYIDKSIFLAQYENFKQ